MKKTLAFVAIMVLVVSAFSLGFTDVGEDHWAYDYVMKLVEKGVIPVDEPTFRGYEPLTRSDAAVWMSRLVTYLENSPEIAKTRDLNYLEEKVNNASKKVNTVESNLNALSEELNQNDLLADLQATYSDVKKTAYRAKNIGDSLEKDLLALSQEVSGLNAKVSSMESTLNQTKQLAQENNMFVKALPALSTKVVAIERKVSDLEKMESTLNQTKQLAEENNMFIKALPALSTKVANLEKKVNATENKVAELEKFRTTMAQQHLNLKYDTYDKIDVLNNQVDLNEAKILELSQQVEAQNEEIAKAQDNTMLWLVAGLGVVLGVVGIFLP
ncbi:hypothetical protein PW5551_06755 [Petrotoga sp. 9PW.55.5.1]|uniref:S-layer homology domain-containing protein n=1 Tax=Petrotoga sp. 9PW.55.5.1 TaxID=1308979 RepID=UPI000DC32B6A|nr:S-layer homology domain-containing protein [Petrotoga sp. 9PW.55.5.1]RAO98955.1 hypothetical protein PW5551_06755 [Petrotoga sp. 9PW.55.5.1]